MTFKVGDIIENKKLVIRWLVTDVGEYSYQLHAVRGDDESLFPKEVVDAEFKLVSRPPDEVRSR
jgi:hypothetical protein|tara:strand:+ start:294 stop:485 length:192 start_codon:yes stop_codon:yes gene_type:complete